MNELPQPDKVHITVSYKDGSKREYVADPAYIGSEQVASGEYYLDEERVGVDWFPTLYSPLMDFHLHMYRVNELEVKVTEPQPVDVEAIIEDDDKAYAEEQRRKRAKRVAELTIEADKLLREIFGGPVAFRHDRGNTFELSGKHSYRFVVERDEDSPEFTNAGGKDLRPYVLYKSGSLRGQTFRIKITRPADFRRH